MNIQPDNIKVTFFFVKMEAFKLINEACKSAKEKQVHGFNYRFGKWDVDFIENEFYAVDYFKLDSKETKYYNKNQLVNTKMVLDVYLNNGIRMTLPNRFVEKINTIEQVDELNNLNLSLKYMGRDPNWFNFIKLEFVHPTGE